jgi:hypothetical protein
MSRIIPAPQIEESSTPKLPLEDRINAWGERKGIAMREYLAGRFAGYGEIIVNAADAVSIGAIVAGATLVPKALAEALESDNPLVQASVAVAMFNGVFALYHAKKNRVAWRTYNDQEITEEY